MKNPNLIGIALIFAITVAMWSDYVINRSVELKTIQNGDSRSVIAVYGSIGLGTVLLFAINALSIAALIAV